MYWVVSQAQLSLDNSGMHIFTASQPSLGLRHHFHCCDGAIVQILPSWKTISGNFWQCQSSFLLCPPERVFGSQTYPQSITQSSSSTKAHCLSSQLVTPKRSRWRGGAQCMNESSCRSLDRRPPRAFPCARLCSLPLAPLP